MSIEARTVFCDDIRREDNGKAILIGVYTGDLIPAAIPSNFPISFWIDIRGLTQGRFPIKITISLPGSPTVDIPGDINVVNPEEPVAMIVSGVPVSIHSTGAINVAIEIDGRVLPAGQLIVRQPLTANAVSMPS